MCRPRVVWTHLFIWYIKYSFPLNSPPVSRFFVLSVYVDLVRSCESRALFTLKEQDQVWVGEPVVDPDLRHTRPLTSRTFGDSRLWDEFEVSF